VEVGVEVCVDVAVAVGVSVGEAVAVEVEVAVGSGVAVNVGVDVSVGDGVSDGVGVADGVFVGTGVEVGASARIVTSAAGTLTVWNGPVMVSWFWTTPAVRSGAPTVVEVRQIASSGPPSLESSACRVIDCGLAPAPSTVQVNAVPRSVNRAMPA
jgi:hypothetical protein